MVSDCTHYETDKPMGTQTSQDDKPNTHSPCADDNTSDNDEDDDFSELDSSSESETESHDPSQVADKYINSKSNALPTLGMHSSLIVCNAIFLISPMIR